MTTQVSTKVRLVRCPKCRQVLAELPEVPLYKCGGCGTVLQAKNRKVETNSAELSSQETHSVSNSRQDDVLEARSSNNDFVSPHNVESSLDKDNMRCQDENGDSVELCEDRSVSNGLSSSPEVTRLPNEDSSIEADDFSKHSSLGQNSKRYHSEFRDDNGEWTGGGNFSDELPSSGEYTLEDEVYATEASELVEQRNKSHSHQDDRVLQESDNFLSEHEDQESVLPPEGIKDDYVPPENDENSRIGFTDRNGEIKPADENDNVSQSAEQSIEADDGAEGRLIFRRERNTNASIGDSIVSCQSPSKESLVSFYLSSPDNEHLNRFSRETTRNFGRVSSVDTLGTANYPKTESYYAYDGSESSYDGTDDQIRENISRPSRKNKDVDISMADMLGKNSEPERSYWATSSSHRAMENLTNNRNRTRLDKQEGISRLPFASRDPLTSYRHSSLPPRPGFNSSVKPSYSEPDRIELLRTVCELKDQLNRMQFPEVRRFPAGAVDGKFASFQYDHLTPEREMYSDVNHPHGYTLRHNQAKNVSRMAFSGEAAPHYRHQVSCSCLHCCPQDWRYSAQLPPHTVHGKNRHCGVHTDQSCCNSSSPQHYTSSETSLWGHETQSDDQRHDEIKRLRLKEKYHAAKRHLRPVAGGAPVVACYHCSELLHLPADFLLFKKKYHRLMCNACKKVLRFSLLRGTHIVPYVPEASAPPPPSEADEYNGATSRRNLKPISRSSSGRHVETVSCSDDYGRSFCSTEGEGSVIDRNSYNRKMSSGSSYEPIEDRKMKSVLREVQDKNESLLEPVEAVGPSSSKWRKGSSEIESSSNSPLHRLMGYPSLSQVLDK